MSDSARHLVQRLFDEQHASLTSFFRRRLRDKQQATDFTQEVYLRILRVRDSDLIQNPEGYLFTVAANLIKEQALAERLSRAAVDITDTTVEAEMALAPVHDEDADLAARTARLREVLTQLSPKCQAAVVLQYQHELSYQQIGERLGVSGNMVKKYLSQALAHCRRRMERWR